jgi:hypothetical protein
MQGKADSVKLKHSRYVEGNVDDWLEGGWTLCSMPIVYMQDLSLEKSVNV